MMSEELGQDRAETGKGPHEGPGGDVNPGTQGARSLLRRRMVMRGLVAAPAALAVMRPIKTLAKAKKVCSYSGWHSFKMDPHSSSHPKDKCKQGYNTKFYYGKYESKIPKSKTKSHGRVTKSPYTITAYNNSTVYLYQTTTFITLFGTNPGDNPKKPTTILTYLGEPSTNQAAYLTALFNAYYFHTSGYPYKTSQIYEFWATPTSLAPGLDQTLVAQYFDQLNSFG
jgi:hypothetical protein